MMSARVAGTTIKAVPSDPLLHTNPRDVTWRTQRKTYRKRVPLQSG